MVLLDRFLSLLDHHLVRRGLIIRQLRTGKRQASDRCDLLIHSKVCDDVLVRPAIWRADANDGDPPPEDLRGAHRGLGDANHRHRHER